MTIDRWHFPMHFLDNRLCLSIASNTEWEIQLCVTNMIVILCILNWYLSFILIAVVPYLISDMTVTIQFWSFVPPSILPKHDDVIKWKHFLRNCSFVWGIHRSQRPVTQSFDVFFDLLLIKRLSKHSWGWWFEMPSSPLWHHCSSPWPTPDAPQRNIIWVRSWRCGCLVTWFCYQMIAKPGKKTAVPPWPESNWYRNTYVTYCITYSAHFYLLIVTRSVYWCEFNVLEYA